MHAGHVLADMNTNICPLRSLVSGDFVIGNFGVFGGEGLSTVTFGTEAFVTGVFVPEAFTTAFDTGTFGTGATTFAASLARETSRFCAVDWFIKMRKICFIYVANKFLLIIMYFLSRLVKKRHPTYLMVLPTELQILLWQYRYFKDNLCTFFLKPTKHVKCYMVDNKQHMISLPANILHAKKLYAMTDYIKNNIIQIEADTEIMDILYSTGDKESSTFVLLKIRHVIGDQDDRESLLYPGYSVLPPEIKGKLTFYVSKMPQNLEKYLDHPMY